MHLGDGAPAPLGRGDRGTMTRQNLQQDKTTRERERGGLREERGRERGKWEGGQRVCVYSVGRERERAGYESA